MGVLDIRNVVKIYPGHGPGDEPVKALADVSFTVGQDEFCSVLGHSGCGKTTLLNIIAGFDDATLGSLQLDGKPIGRPGWERAMIFQDYALFPWLTVLGNVAFGLEMKRVPADERTRIAQRQIELVGLSGFEHRYPHQLSGGMRQRVAIARALAVDPAVLLMDEPFAALDAQNRSMLQDEMVRIFMEQRKTMVLVTHSIEEAIKLSDRIIVMTRRPGRVKANIEVDMPRPRREESPEFVALKARIRDLIHDEFDLSEVPGAAPAAGAGSA
ncbi:MAG: ABC transporter ATP-binding protein [bacterium]|jgi:NitT/TauT family transport system ATP-binding protein|nr:ABC transporter ATP-binding protein [Betaproteobacteria bacterium]